MKIIVLTGNLVEVEQFSIPWCSVRTSGHMFIIIIGIQPLGRFGQRPELNQATGMALVRYILGKFLGVVCHCFSPRLDVPTFATSCHEARDPSGGSWNCGRECSPVILPK